MTWSNVYTCLIFGSTFLLGILFLLIPLLKENPLKKKVLIISIFTLVHFGIVFLSTYLDSLIINLTKDAPIHWSDLFFIRYLVIYLVDILVLFFLGKANISTSLFIVNLGYCFQHACHYFYQIIIELLQIGLFTWEAFLIRFAFTALFATAFYFLTRKRLKTIDESKIKMNAFLVFFTTAATFFLIILNSIFWTMATNKELPIKVQEAWKISILLFTASIAVLLVMLQLSVLKTDELMDDLKMTKKMLKEENDHYEREKAIIDVLNVKSHDLKHQLMNAKKTLSNEDYEELGKIVSSYDSFVKTGNAAVDVILTEKELLCQKNNIRFTAMIDGRKLTFMKESDLYSLLGNILDNAMEAVAKLTKDEDKVISISTEEKGGFLLIHQENLYDGNIVFKNDELQTTKDDKLYHGFGTKSIKLIVNKYNGDVSIKTSDRKFVLDIMLPMKEI